MTGASWRLVATPLIAVAAGLGVAGLSGMVLYGSWLRLVAAVLAATAAVVLLGRLATGRPFVPTILGAVAGAWLLLVAYVPTADGGRTWVPTPSTVEQVRLVAQEAVAYANRTVAPAPVEPALAAAIAAAVIALFLVADALAVSAGFAASSGFVLLLPWLPALTLERSVPTAALAGALAAWLAVVALSRRVEGAGWRHRADAGAAPAPLRLAAAATAMTVLFGLVLAPLAIGGPGWGAVPRISLPETFGSSRLDLELDLQDSLNNRSEEPFFTYATTSGDPVGVLRMYSFATFDGTRWDRDVQGDTVPAEGVLWPEEVDIESTEADLVTIQVGDFAEPRLPLPAAPRALDGSSSWLYDASTDEVVVDGVDGIRFLDYELLVARDFLSAETLRSSSTVAAAGDEAVPARYLDLSPRIDIAAVRAFADAAVAGTEGRYEQAVALQEVLRGPGSTYNTRVGALGEDAVTAFLQNREGYCVHFATAMVVLARSLDIPARLAVGFLGGEEEGDGNFVVRGSDAHAWPEIYFPGQGWVRFEPTPAQQTGFRPEYTASQDGESPSVAPPVPTSAPTSTPQAPVPDADAEDPGADEAAGSAQSGTTTAIVAAIAVAVLGAAAVGWARVRRGAVGVRTPEDAWLLLRRRLHDAAGPDALTPSEAEEWIVDQGLDEDARAALASLTTALSDHRYAPRGSDASPEELTGWVDAVVRGVRHRQRERDRRAASSTR